MEAAGGSSGDNKANNGISGIAGVAGTTGKGGGLLITGGQVTMAGSIIAMNTAVSGPDCWGSFLSNDYNLVTDADECTVTWDANDLINDDASPLNLGALADNSWETKTHAILPGSTAYNRIPYGVNGCGTIYSTDQRNVVRPGGGACEIGAYEFQMVGFLPFIRKP